MSTGYSQFKDEDASGGPLGTTPMEAPPQYYPRQQPAPALSYNTQDMIQLPSVVSQPPYAGQSIYQRDASVTVPNDYFGFALFVVICCCLPLGIVAMVRSSECRSRAAAGDIHGAMMASKDAQRYSRIGCAIGITVWVLTLTFLGVWLGLCFASEYCG